MTDDFTHTPLYILAPLEVITNGPPLSITIISFTFFANCTIVYS